MEDCNESDVGQVQCRKGEENVEKHLDFATHGMGNLLVNVLRKLSFEASWN